MPEIYQPTYYFKTCCPKQTLTDNYFGVSNFTISPIPSVDDVFLVKLPSFTGCSSIVTSIPTGSVIYAGENATVTPYTDCETCIVDYSCWRTPTTPKITYVNVNECGVSTIFPMEVECVITNPTTPISNNGTASISITGGTPPYTVRWGNGNISSSIINLKPGSYPAVVSDYWDDYVINTTCVLSAQSYNYLLDQCCPSTLYWKLPNNATTNLTGATITSDCVGLNSVISGMTNDLRNCYCDTFPPEKSCITDKYIVEPQTCGRKTIKYNAGGELYYWFVQNLDYTFSVYSLSGATPGTYNILNYSGCCSQSYMTGFTNNSVYSSDCGSYTGTGLFDWYNRTVSGSSLDEKYLFHPYYNSGTTKCMVSGGSNQEIVTISSDYNVLGKNINFNKTLNGSTYFVSYTVSSLVNLPPTVVWTPGSIYDICQFDYFYNRS
jgi:hypothetical protein